MDYIKKYFLSENDDSQSIKVSRRNKMKALFEAVLEENNDEQRERDEPKEGDEADILARIKAASQARQRGVTRVEGDGTGPKAAAKTKEVHAEIEQRERQATARTGEVPYNPGTHDVRGTAAKTGKRPPRKRS